MRKRILQIKLRARRGAILPLVGAVLVVLLVVGGVAVEQARLRLAHLELQAASDNIARSCANELMLSDSQFSARRRGKDIASRYSVGNRAFALRDQDIVFGRVFNGNFFPYAFPPMRFASPRLDRIILPRVPSI